MIPERSKQALWTALGVSAGVATGVWLWRRGQDTAPPAPQERTPDSWARPRGSAADVAEALQRDRTLRNRSIEVDAIAEGVIELTGHVGTRTEAQRAVGIAQAISGVYTVVNRLTLDEEEAHRRDTQRRRREGAPELQERGHTGMGVGMEARRQSPDTDPDRPSDKQKILERELDVANVEDTPEGGLEPISGAEAVESSDVKPGDEMAIRDADLDPEPRPTSTPKESVAEEGDDRG